MGGNLLLEANPGIMFFFDREGIFRAVFTKNPEELIVPANEIIGKKVEDLFPPEIARIHKESLNKVFEGGFSQIYEYSIRLNDKDCFFEARVVSLDESQQLAMVQNVTPQKRSQKLVEIPERKRVSSLDCQRLVLLVEDEEFIRLTTQRMLEYLGYQVLPASDGDHAVELLRNKLPEVSCIILDLTMPKMDGEETFREIRKLDSDIPIILSSGHCEREATQKFFGKNLSGFLQKPFHLETLDKTLKQAIASSLSRSSKEKYIDSKI
ncbi:MAG: response regulator [Candidatus Riflebacteria bacterium]|nr:response regulator [Candidatus Riflebacteria bacterium]